MAWLMQGIVLGLAIAAPVGPIGMLCMRRTLTLGFVGGFISGLGAAAADAVYGSVAGFGISTVTNVLMEYKGILQVLGALFLCGLGIQSFLHKPEPRLEVQLASTGLLRSFASTFLLTLSNPMTIMSFLGIFGAFGLLGSQSRWEVTWLVAGVFLGSVLWWVFLAGLTAFIKERMAGRSNLAFFHRLSGLVMLGFAVHVFLQIWRG